MHRPNLTVAPAPSSAGSSSTASGRWASSTPGAGRTVGVRGRGRSCAAGRSTRRSCCSSPASATPRTCGPRHRAGPAPARGRREPPGPPRGLRPARLQAAGVDATVPGEVALRRGSARSGCSCTGAREPPTTSRRGGFVRSNDDVDYPNLMFHFLPIAVRYDGTSAGPRPRLPGAHRTDVLRRPRLGADRARDPKVHPALRFNYLSTEKDRREWVEAIRVARAILDQPALDDVQRRRDSPGPSVRDRRGDPRLGRQGRRDRPAPLVHGEDGHR